MPDKMFKKDSREPSAPKTAPKTLILPSERSRLHLSRLHKFLADSCLWLLAFFVSGEKWGACQIGISAIG